MTDQWIVLLDTGRERFAYGPTEDEDTANDFAAFLTAEVDPAVALKLRSPTKELLAYWQQQDEEPVEIPNAANRDPDWYVQQRAEEGAYIRMGEQL